jgi:heme exporter protein A
LADFSAIHLSSKPVRVALNRSHPVQLVAENLNVIRGARVIIADVSLSVAAGESLLLTGPNGSGKTTLLRTIAGFLQPESGSVRLEGGDGELDLGQQCHYVGHLSGTKSALTVAANLAFWAEYLGGGDLHLSTRERVSAALERFGLEPLADIPAGFLSAGQRRRLGLARILLAKRPVWLLDEPTASLDTASTALLAEVVTAHVAGGGILVAATHLPLGIEGAKYLRLGTAAEAA